MHRPIERRHAGEGDAAFRILDEQPPHHLQLAGDAGEHDGIVDIADHDMAAVFRRDEDLRRRGHRFRLLQHQIHVVPALAAGRQFPDLQVNPEIAVAVGHGPLLGIAEPGAHRRVGDGAADDPAADVAQMGRQIVLAAAMVRMGLPEHPADQEDFFP